tara:strand:- start:866 stop:1255 length:390 start_codon:yes stop_codon:yes gene_type:complete
MKILFICKHNRFRSKVAEAFFKKYNKNKKHHVMSRGIISDIDVAKTVISALGERGAKIRSKKSVPVTRKEIIQADKIIIVANDVPKSIFENKNTEIWKIRDTSQVNLDDIRKIVREIENKVLILVGKLK